MIPEMKEVPVSGKRPLSGEDRAAVALLAAAIIVACCCGAGCVGTLWAVFG